MHTRARLLSPPPPHRSIIYYYYFPFLPRCRRRVVRRWISLVPVKHSLTARGYVPGIHLHTKNNVTGAGGGDYFHDDDDNVAEVSCRCVRASVLWRSKRNVSARRRTVLRVHAIIIYKRIPNTETTKAELLHVTQLPSGKKRFRRRNT